MNGGRWRRGTGRARLPVAAAVSLAAVALVACSRPPPHPTPAPTVALAAGATDEAADDAEAAPDEPPDAGDDPWRLEGLPPPIEPQTATACTLRGKPPDRLRARFRAGGPVVYALRGAPAEMRFPGDDPLAGVHIEAERDGVRLRGVLNREDVSLFAAEPFLLGGFLIPRSNTRLSWRGVERGRLEIAIGALEGVELVEPVGGVRPCEQLGIEQASSFGEWAGLPDDLPPRTGWAKVTGTKAVPLSRAPKGDPVARLRVAGDLGAAVYDTARGYSRVAFPTGQALLVGWVPSGRLASTPEKVVDLGSMWGHGAGGGGAQVSPLVCPHRLVFALRLGDRARTVGIAEPGVRIVRLRRVGLHTRIRFHRRHWLDAAEGAVWLVRQADLAGCTIDDD